MHNVIDNFHPAVANWFRRTYTAPTEPQIQAWPAIQSGQHVLIAAPTGSGKTLAAFLAAHRRPGATGRASPAARRRPRSSTSRRSRRCPTTSTRTWKSRCAGIREELSALGFPEVEIRTLVRTGDTPQADRDRMRRKPPHILVTTPESLYILLTSESGRKTLASTRTVIVDEIHALAPNKRGVASLAVPRAPRAHHRQSTDARRAVGDSEADRRDRALSGGQRRPPGERSVRHPTRRATRARRLPAIVDTGHVRKRDLAIEVPDSPLEAVMSGEVWGQIYERLTSLIQEHRSTLVFVNTRRLAERVARALTERLGENRSRRITAAWRASSGSTPSRSSSAAS